MTETAFTFDCQGVALVGILHAGAAGATRGVLIVVGGPQYRVGSHRQFLLLARALAGAGIPVLRFDYRGMGDAEGEPVTFENSGPDIHAAVEAFFQRIPTLRDVVLWGLCDAASAILFYAWQDARVSGLVLLNPWVRTEAGQARAYLKHYYWQRLRDPELWTKLARGQFNFTASLRSWWGLLRTTLTKSPTTRADNRRSPAVTSGSLPDWMADSFRQFHGPVLFILSGNDLTAAEFKDLVAKSRDWSKLLAQPHVTRQELAAANHTFSRREWRDQVVAWTLTWLQSW